MQHGIRVNATQFAHLVLQVLLVGLMLGMMRTVVPALAESEYGVPRQSFVLLGAFVVAFGIVKGVLNFVAGRLSERYGRMRMLLAGWLFALPIPWTVAFAPSWGWVVAATVLLGVQQGFCWSMTQTAKLDITHASERGLTLGLNEFAGYVGVAAAGIATAYLAAAWGARTGLLVFGLAVTAVAIASVLALGRETLPWARTEASGDGAMRTGEVFALVSWRDRRLAVLCQAGLVEKFVDALVWVVFPVFLHQRGLTLPEVGWVIGAYGFVWGGSQLFTGRLSDHVGRHRLNVWGMWLCGAGVAMMLVQDGVAWWALSAATSGLGMAMLYPNLSAAVADVSHPAWRGTAIGIYRFWRDIGYAIGALGLGLAAHLSGSVTSAFAFVAASMILSGLLLQVFGEETHPGLRAAPAAQPSKP
jgi:MFS family permease